MQSPQFSEKKPKVINSLKELETNEFNVPDRRINKKIIIGEEGKIHPYSVQNPSLSGVSDKNWMQEIIRIKNVSDQLAMNDSSREEVQHKWQTAGFMLLTGSVVFMVMLMGLIAMTTLVDSRTGDVNGINNETIVEN